MQGNLKGVPQLVTAQVLRRHSMAIRYIRRSLEVQESHALAQPSAVNQDPSAPNHYEEGLPLGIFMGSDQASSK